LPDTTVDASASTLPLLAAPLLAASTVFLTASALLHPQAPPSLAAPVIRRVYFPPLALWRGFLSRLDADPADPAPLDAAEVFDALVDDGMTVLDALSSSVELAA
jgi:hypothetical protein